MRNSLTVPTVVAACCLAASQDPSAQLAARVAFTHVTTVPMDSPRVVPDQTVVVEKGRISVVGPAASVAIPDDAVRVDGDGKFLMPGLAEMHGHIPPMTAPREQIEAVLFLYAANGVTTVRGMQGAPGQLELREAARLGGIVSPMLYLAGPPFSGSTVTDPDQAVAKVKLQKFEGWDLLKVLTGLTRDCYDAMAKTAREAGMRFGGHVPADVGVLHALEMGQDTFDHLDGFAEHLDALSKPVNGAALQDLVARTKKAGAWVVPTMVVWETLRGPVTLESRTSLPELRYLPRAQVQGWTRQLESRLKSPQFNPADAAQYMKNRTEILRALHKGGVGILLGSDAPQQFNVPGFSIHREMVKMTEAGMSPFDILASGTVNVGRYFHEDFGTIAAGQRADLVLVDANPLDDVANAAKRSGVMLNGRWIPESEIQTRLQQIARANEGAPAAPQ